MKKSSMPLAMAALMAVPAGAIAGDSVVRFANHFYKKSETTLPDGRKALALKYYMNTSDKADDPVNNTAG